MSRLNSVIRRLQAQRACLDLAIERISGLDGPILELGLGNGRTFDHLREHAAGREIYVFDRRIAAHPDSIPDPQFFFEGDITDTLAAAAGRLPALAVLAHCDIGTGDAAANAALATAIAPVLDPLMADGALIVSDQRMDVPHWIPVTLPEGVAEGRYNIRRISRPAKPGARSGGLK